MKSVVILTHGIGDVVMHLPLLQALVSKKNDRLAVVTKSHVESGFVNLLLDDSDQLECIPVHMGKKNRLSRFSSLCLRLRGFRPDAIVTSYNTDPVLAGVLSLASGAKWRVGPGSSPISSIFFNKRLPDYEAFAKTAHKTDYAILAAEHCGRTAPNRIHAEHLSKEIARTSISALGLPSRYACIALGSGLKEQHKRLDKSHSVRLMTELLEAFPDLAWILLGTDSEQSLNRELASVPNFSGLDLTNRTNLCETIHVLRNAEFLISSCNGISHLAVLAATPIVGLYGPTNSKLTGPYGAVLEAVSLKLDCAPCYSRAMPYGCGNPECMRIEPSKILSAVATLRSRKKASPAHLDSPAQ